MADPKVTVRIGAKDEASDVVKRTGLTFRSVANEIGERFVITASDIARVFTGITSVIGDSIDAFAESELAAKKLDAALARLGPSAAGVSAALQDQARALQETTVFSDDAIVAGQALLANFTQSEDQLKSGTTAALDFAVATGTDLRSAFLLLGKAAEGNTAALSRYGVVIDDATPATEKFAAAVEGLNNLFGGQAAAQAETYSGRIAQLKNQLVQVQVGFGRLFVEVINSTNALSGSQDVISGYAESLRVTANALPGLTKNTLDWANNLKLTAITLTQGNEAGQEFLRQLLAQKDAQAAAAASAADLAEKRSQLAQAANEAAEAEKKLAEANKLLGVTTQEDVNAKVLALTQALILVRGEYERGAIGAEAFAAAQAKFRAELDKIDPALTRISNAAKALGVELGDETAQKIEAVKTALETLRLGMEAGTVTDERFRAAKAAATTQLAALGDQATLTNQRIAETAAQAVAEQETLAASFRDAADAADKLAEAAERSGEAASKAATGWLEFSAARSSDPRTDVEIAQTDLDTVKAFGSFVTTIDGRGSLGATQDAERRLAAARAAETNGGSGAGGTAPLTSGPGGRLAGGSRSVSSTGQLR